MSTKNLKNGQEKGHGEKGDKRTESVLSAGNLMISSTLFYVISQNPVIDLISKYIFDELFVHTKTSLIPKLFFFFL